jgi:hypothetical protein
MKKDFTRDFRDIQYFIDHVYNLDVVTKDSVVGRVIKGKKGELRIQVTPAIKSFPLVKSVILEQ